MVFPTLCGPEIGVASTKALTAQLTALASLADRGGRCARHDLAGRRRPNSSASSSRLPSAVSAALGAEGQIEDIAKRLSKAKDVLYLGRGPMFPVAMEGALKLKEISYIHAEGYAGRRTQARPDRAGRRADAGDRRRAVMTS